MSNLISSVSWVRRGVASQNPNKYVLDDKELERVSALAKIELEDARVELERAHLAAQSMGKGAEEEADDHGVSDVEEDDNDANWVEWDFYCIDCVCIHSLCVFFSLRSEDDSAMDIDSGSRKKQGSDDLEQYKLDEYDNEAKASGMMIANIFNSRFCNMSFI